MAVGTTSQKYSQIVFARIQKNIERENDINVLRRYKSLCKRSGGILRTVGLVQYLAFLKAKSKKYEYYKMLLNDLTAESGNGDNADAFLQKVYKMSLSDYMQLTRTALLLLQWHKRVSDILIDGTCESGEDDQ